MRTDLSDTQLASYRENGFLVIEDFLERNEIDELDSAVEEYLAGLDDKPVSSSSNLAHLMNPFQSSERIRAFSTDPRLAELTASLEDVKDIRLYQDMVAIKPAWGGPTPFHMDVPRISFTSDQTVSYWFPLVDVTMLNAPLHYLPGLHREKRADCRDAYEMHELDRIDPSWSKVEAVAAPVRRGGVVLHEGYAPHGTNANMTPHPRTVFVITHMPDGAVFDGTPNLVQPGEMPVGAPLDDEDRFPMILRSGTAHR